MKDEAASKESLQAKGKSKHVTTACTNCRKKKIKCDFNRPRCSNCVLYSQDCIFPSGIDKRKIPTKDRITALTTHVQHLETLLRQHGVPFQAMFDSSSISTPDRQDIPGFTGGGQDSETLRRASTNDTWIEEAVTNGSNEALLPVESTSNPFGPSPSSGVQPSYSSPPAGEESLIDQLTGRMGSMQIAEDGQRRFYGATSNLHFLHNGPMSLTRSRFSSMQAEGETLLKNRGLDQYVDREFEDHLLKLYFCWEDPSIHVMDEQLFFREREKCKATHETSYLYSEVVVNAM